MRIWRKNRIKGVMMVAEEVDDEWIFFSYGEALRKPIDSGGRQFDRLGLEARSRAKGSIDNPMLLTYRSARTMP